PSLSISPFTRSLSPPHFVSFHHPATAEICTLSLHDALPIYSLSVVNARYGLQAGDKFTAEFANLMKNTFRGSDTLARYSGNHFLDRKSTRLNSSHRTISYAVFCLKKKKHNTVDLDTTYGYYQ